MKAGTGLALVALLVIAGRSHAGQMDKARLRALAKLPEINFAIGVGFSTISGLRFGENADHLAEIERLQKQMRGDPSDAERYLLLGRHYRMAERTKEAEKAWAKAVALCRQQVREHPADRSWLIRLGEALIYTGDTKESEKVLRRAVKEAPTEWRGWLALAECLDGLSARAIFGEKPVSFHIHDAKLLIPALLQQKPTAEQIAEMRRLRKEARRYYDRAVELAQGKEAKPYLRRLAWTGGNGILEAGLRILQGERVNPTAFLHSPEYIADMRQIARLSSDDPRTIGAAVLLEIVACVVHDKLKRKGDFSSWTDYRAARSRSLVDVLPAESREFVRWGTERLEQLTTHANKLTAAAASEILADRLLMEVKGGEDLGVSLPISAKTEAIAKIAQYLRRTVRLDPSRESAWDSLSVLLVEEKNTEEAITIARKRIEVKDNARTRFFLAKAYAADHQFEKAAEALQAGLKLNPNDLHCRLGLIALELKLENAQTLKTADEQLEAIAPEIKEAKNKQLWLNYHLLCGIRSALIDRPDWAKGTFQQILEQEPGEMTATRSLVALGEPLKPVDQPLAIAYIKEQRGQVRRKDDKASSPVERIHLSRDYITDDDLFVLTAFPQLRELDLSFSAITDDGLSAIGELTQIEYLSLAATRITDSGLAHLHRLKQLQRVNVRSTKVTPQGIAELRKALPKLEVFR